MTIFCGKRDVLSNRMFKLLIQTPNRRKYNLCSLVSLIICRFLNLIQVKNILLCVFGGHLFCRSSSIYWNPKIISKVLYILVNWWLIHTSSISHLYIFAYTQVMLKGVTSCLLFFKKLHNVHCMNSSEIATLKMFTFLCEIGWKNFHSFILKHIYKPSSRKVGILCEMS